MVRVNYGSLSSKWQINKKGIKAMTKLKVKVTLEEPALGMNNANSDSYSKYMEYKRTKLTQKQIAAGVEIGQEDEVNAMKAAENNISSTTVEEARLAYQEKKLLVFPRHEGQPIWFNFQMSGALKNFFKILLKNGEGIWQSSKAKTDVGLSLYTANGKVDDLVFIKTRRIPITIPEGAEIDFYGRRIEAMTAQGPRITWTVSERIPSGSSWEFEMNVNDKLVPYVKEALAFTSSSGFGGNRNSHLWGLAECEVMEIRD